MSEILPPASYGLPQRERVPRTDYIRSLSDMDRQRNPHLYLNSPDGLGPKWLFVENVAAMLDCTVDFVRRISRRELPAGRIGKRMIYSRADVDEFIAGKIRTANARFVSVRKSRSPALSTAAPDVPASSFDPISTIRAQRSGK